MLVPRKHPEHMLCQSYHVCFPSGVPLLTQRHSQFRCCDTAYYGISHLSCTVYLSFSSRTETKHCEGLDGPCTYFRSRNLLFRIIIREYVSSSDDSPRNQSNSPPRSVPLSRNRLSFSLSLSCQKNAGTLDSRVFLFSLTLEEK